MSARERRKGASGELEVVHIVRSFGWRGARRTSDGRLQVGRGDIAGGPEGCHFEVKRHEKLNVPKAWRQIDEDADPLDIPVLVHRPRCRRSRKPEDEWMATLPLVELLALLRWREDNP